MERVNVIRHMRTLKSKLSDANKMYTASSSELEHDAWSTIFWTLLGTELAGNC